MSLEIKHSLYKACGGSARLISGNKVAIAILHNLIDNSSKTDEYNELSLDIKVRCATSSKADDLFIALFISRIANLYILTSLDKGRTLSLHICTNTLDLSLICNTVLVACMDAGIPLSMPFFSVGDSSKLLIFENRKLFPIFILGDSTGEDHDVLVSEAEYIREAVTHALRDMFMFK
ncbi:hypothetical protein PAEPH01_1749 [Pancytospora epiphaga]|nr:hypothetical protein PAEPH01_1749 [Pancytospora epiphaga]